MIIRVNETEIAVKNIYSNTMRRNGKDYPALRIVFDGAVTTEEIESLLSGCIQIIDDNGFVSDYFGYTTPGEHSIVIGKITTTEQERDELKAALAIEEAKKPYIETLTENLDDATASTVIPLYPVMQYDGNLIEAGTRINWNGTLKRAAVNLWDRQDSNPDNAPDLWEDIQYRDGYRIIPDEITVGLVFGMGECGWWGNVLYRSKLETNTYTPEQYPDGWEIVE